MNKLILIGGIPRSGTNLARRIIGSHSKIAIPPGEFQFFYQYMKGKSVKQILDNIRLRSWNIDFSNLYSYEHQKAFIKALIRYTESIGKDIPGEKSPLNEFFYDIILDWLRDFEIRFIHLVRNPFDVMASYKYFNFLKNKRKSTLNSINAHIINWNRSVSMGLARSYYNPSKYYVLKYEDLASDPVGKTKELCEFIGVNFEKERMLRLSDYSGYNDNTSFKKNSGKSHKDYRGINKPESRKHYLDGSEIRRVVTVCGELALALGYKDTDFHQFPPEQPSLSAFKNFKKYVRNLL